METYDKIFDIIATEITLKEGSFSEGEMKGRAEGEAIGAQKEKIENARNFKKLGVSIETISKATGLSIEEINKL